MIYNILLRTFLCLFLMLFGQVVLSAQYGRISNSLSVDYSKMDIEKALLTADDNFHQALKEDNKEQKDIYLKDAASNYYIVVSAHPDNIDAVINLARVYDMQNKNRFAKASFYQALGINSQSIPANYYFGEFYYSRDEYRKALHYYRNALRYGLEETPDNMKKLAIIYEKFGDLQKANLYYKKLFLIDPSDDYIADKIREIEDVKYQNSDYYRKGIKNTK